MNKTQKFITFMSRDKTQYRWDNSLDTMINLTDDELAFIKLKVNLMPDSEILNKQSSNGIAMGIPIRLSKVRLFEISEKLISVIGKKPKIILSEHVIERLVLESLDETNTRGWQSEKDVEACILSVTKVSDVRLNVNHLNKSNTDKIIYLHPHFALLIQGKKENNTAGKLVLVIFDNFNLRVVTIL